MGWLNRGAPRKLPALRFGVKVTLAFVSVLAICTASMFVAHTGLERIAVSNAAYRATVKQSDLAREIDRELVAYLAAIRFYLATAREDDATAVLVTQSALGNAIESTKAAVGEPSRQAQLEQLADAFESFTRKFSHMAASLKNEKASEKTIAEISDPVLSITLLSNAIKQDLAADQDRIAREAEATGIEIKGAVGLLAILGAIVGGALALLIGRNVSRKMHEMCAAMRKLAGGQFDVVLPGLGTRDEFGDMAGAVEEFKLQAMAKAAQDAAANEARARSARDARRIELARFADEFEVAVGAIVSNVSASSVQLEAAAGTLLSTAETTQDLSMHVAGASEEASSNMHAVAAATEELTASVEEIGRRVRDSSMIAEGAVLQAKQTDARIGNLSSAAQRIGDVVQLITAIAGKTNLLALNATIEAARAGEAGRGFAVVASEVKLLAGQTAKATGEISAHIAGIQNATEESVAAIKGVGETIGMISGIASTIACAVEQQNSATQEISRNIHGVARGTHDVAENIARVTRGASETGVASGQVLSSAKTLAAESRRLRDELDRFMASFRAA